MAPTFHFTADGKTKHGPVSLQEMKGLVQEGKLRSTDMVRQEGAPRWQPAREIADLFAEVGEDSWVYAPDRKTRLGPVTLAQLQELARSGMLQPDTMVRRGTAKWQPAAEVAGLFAELPALRAERLGAASTMSAAKLAEPPTPEPAAKLAEPPRLAPAARSTAESFDAFLSYSWQDDAQVRQLYLRLQQDGVRLWLDKSELGPDPWRPAIQQAMDAIPCCVIVVGAGGFGHNQKDEIEAALHLHKLNSNYVIIVVLLPGVKDVPADHLFLKKFNQIRFTSSLEETGNLKKLRAWIRKEAFDLGPATTDCPYRGLEKFGVEHANLFFGREELTSTLLYKLAGSLTSRSGRRFLAIEAASGSGKSSLARAGLFARLRNGDLKTSDHWRYAIVQPGSDPLYNLAAEVGKVLKQDAATVLSLKREFANSAETLKTHLDLSLGDEPDHVRFLLLVDQFEELYTTCKDEAARNAFIGNLLEACQGGRGRGVVIVTVRADFLGKCAGHGELAQAMSDNCVLIGPMNDEELRRAIERPAALRNCLFEPGLVEQLLSDVKRQSGNLPLLQFALKELWQKKQGNQLTLEAYRAIGGVQGALEQHAEKVYAQAGEQQQEAWRRLFLRLTNPGEGTEDTRRRVSLKEVEGLQDVVGKLSEWETRLLTVGKQEGQEGEFVEVAHEALIRSWSRLRQWIDSDRTSLQTQRRLTEAARQWQEKNKDVEFLLSRSRLAAMEEFTSKHLQDLTPLEKEFIEESRAHADRQRRRKRRMVAAVISSLGVLSLLLAGLALFAFIQMDRADNNATKAEERRQTAVEALDSLTDVADSILLNAPQMEDRQAELLKQALERRAELLDDQNTGKTKLARDHYRLAKVRRRLGEFDKAREQYQRAVELLQDTDQDRLLLAVCLTDFADLLRQGGRPKEAHEQVQKAIELQAALEKQDPHNREVKLEAARTFNILGLVCMDADRARAKVAFAEAVQRLDDLEKADRSNLDCKAEMGHVKLNLGVWYANGKKFEDAVQSFKGAIAKINEVREARATRKGDLEKLAMAQMNLAEMYRKTQQHDREAEKLFHDAILLYERLCGDFPGNINLKNGLRKSRINLGNALRDKGDLGGAIAEYQAALKLDPKATVVTFIKGQLARAERMRELLAGRAEPENPAETCEFAALCAQPFHKRYAEAAGLYDKAFQADAKLADDLEKAHRYFAACAAARAARADRGDPLALAVDRAALRQKALDWLGADLVLRKEQAASADAAKRMWAAGALTIWLKNEDLAQTRPDSGRSDMAPAEQAAWNALWADVRTTLDQAQKPLPSPK